MAAKKETYSQAMERLEKIVRQIDNNELDIDILSEKIKEANEIIAFCKDKLTKADREVEKLLQEKRLSEELKLFLRFNAIENKLIHNNMKEIDWANLSFGYMKTDYNVRINFRNGAWGELEVSSDEHLNLHMAATCLHYGQEAFEGLKAFRGKDGKVRIFRLEENAARLQSTCQGILMAELPTERFKEAILKVVKLNERFIPPYETGASLYIRPLLIGTSAQVGVHPAEEYMFVVFVTPVGPYFKGGFSTNPYVIIREFDRAAPHGTGIYKVGGNYAASLRANKKAHDLGYSCEFYLDAKEKKYIDECGAANFFGIKDNTYITPKSTSILPSITNKSLMQLAEDMGIKVERRPIPEEELETFEEAGACGTAAVISPIQRIDDLENGKSYVISKDGKPGPICTKLYNKLRGIQYGDEPDTHGWVTIVE